MKEKVSTSKIIIEGHAVSDGDLFSHFVVKVEDGQGNAVPGVGVTSTVSGGAGLGVNQSIFTTTSDGPQVDVTDGYIATSSLHCRCRTILFSQSPAAILEPINVL